MGCFFDFEDNLKVTKLRKYLSDRHGQTVTEKLPELVQALSRAKESLDKEVLDMKSELESMPGGDSPSSEILESEFHLNAAQMATALLSSWRERGDPQHMDE